MGAAVQGRQAGKVIIEVIKGPHAGLRLDFNKEIISIGRGPENDIILSSDPRVSRRHAEFRFDSSQGFLIVNLSKKNFVMIDGVNIETQRVFHGNVIVIGDTEIVFQSEGGASPSPVSVSNVPSAGKFLEGIGAAVPTPVVVPQQQVPVVPSNAYSPVSSPMPSAYSPAMAQVPMGTYQPGGQTHQQQRNPAANSDGSRLRFYAIIGVVVLLGYFLFGPSGNKKSKDPNAIRTSNIAMQDAAQAEKRSQELLTLKREKYDSVQFRRAQENFVKGFRDFQQGQYARARESFQVVLNLDPDNELAKRYFNLSKIKFDEMVKFNMIQGNRYREKRNWRMCQASFSNVMKMLSNKINDPTFKEASLLFEECRLNSEVRF